MVAEAVRLTPVEAGVVLGAAVIGGLLGLGGVLLGRYLEHRGEIRCKVSLLSFVGAYAVGTFHVEFFNEKRVGIALRDFRFLFYPPEPGEQVIWAYARDRDTRKIMEPVSLAPREAIRRTVVITAENPREGDLYEALLRYGDQALLEALAKSRRAELLCRNFSDEPLRWPVELPGKGR